MTPGPFHGIATSLKILIVTDAWVPQVNGVVRTLEILGEDLGALGHVVRYVTPQGRPSIAMPSYPEIRLALFPGRLLAREIREFAPDAVHIATEGTLGFAARRICLRHGIAFTTAFHTHFPDYVRARFPFVPESLVWSWLRWFHKPATTVMVATQSLKRELQGHGFGHVRLWSRGVDVERFRPIAEAQGAFLAPVWLYVGRLAVEKNIEAFLALDLPGTKVVVGDGPARAELEARYPAARFLGSLTGEALSRAYAGSDIFVFPSRTDTFGLVLLEALASGLTVAAFPVAGPLDVLGDAPVGVLDKDLRKACLGALEIARHPGSPTPREFALGQSWRACTLQFLHNLVVEPDED